MFENDIAFIIDGFLLSDQPYSSAPLSLSLSKSSHYNVFVTGRSVLLKLCVQVCLQHYHRSSKRPLSVDTPHLLLRHAHTTSSDLPGALSLLQLPQAAITLFELQQTTNSGVEYRKQNPASSSMSNSVLIIGGSGVRRAVIPLLTNPTPYNTISIKLTQPRKSPAASQPSSHPKPHHTKCTA